MKNTWIQITNLSTGKVKRHKIIPWRIVPKGQPKSLTPRQDMLDHWERIITESSLNLDDYRFELINYPDEPAPDFGSVVLSGTQQNQPKDGDVVLGGRG